MTLKWHANTALNIIVAVIYTEQSHLPLPNMTRQFPDNVALLRYLYKDLSRISEVCSDDIVLHPADRDLFSPSKGPVTSPEAVLSHEKALIAATGGTLVMDVQDITANAHFGTVLGVLRAKKEGRDDLAIPFCGVWRFRDGQAVEHWENAADALALGRWLMG